MFDLWVIYLQESIYDERLLNDLKNMMIEKIGKYRKYDVERAVDCFLRKNVLCIDYDPIRCSDNPISKELSRRFIDIVKRYRPKDCSMRRFIYTVKSIYRNILEILIQRDLVKSPVLFSLDPDYLRKIYPIFKHYNPISIAAAIASITVPDVAVTRICDIISSTDVFRGCDPGSLTGMVYKAKSILLDNGLIPY